MKTEISDTDRLNWLEKNIRNTAGNCDRSAEGYYSLYLPDGTDYYKSEKRLSFRDAIDAQIKRANGRDEPRRSEA